MVKMFTKSPLHKVKSQSSKGYAESTLFQIQTISELLPEIEKQHYLRTLQEIVAIPESYFKAIYEDLIDNFCNFVQSLPEVYGAELGSLLNEGLRRGLLAIRVMHETSNDKPHPLYVFVVFSVALLSDIGQILNYRIIISEDNGKAVDDWYPLLGPMNEFGEYYKLRPYEGTPASLISSVTPVLAKALLSETALTWLSSNTQMLDIWLAFLNKGEDWAGGLGKVLKIEKREFDNRKKEIGLLPIDAITSEPMTTDLAEKFLAWLKKGIADGSISVNELNSLVHVVPGDKLDFNVFLQAPELFQQFLHLAQVTSPWILVCRQFMNYLGLTKLSGGDFRFEQFIVGPPEAQARKLGFLAKEQQGKIQKEGVLIKDARLIFENQKVPGVSQNIRSVEIQRSVTNALPNLASAGSSHPGIAPSHTNKFKV